MKFGIEILSHTPPYRRVDLSPVRRAIEPADPIDLLAVAMDKLKIEQLWQITKQAAQGCNQPSIAPVEHSQEADSSGWECA
jgi:hypothetical protein